MFLFCLFFLQFLCVILTFEPNNATEENILSINMMHHFRSSLILSLSSSSWDGFNGNVYAENSNAMIGLRKTQKLLLQISILLIQVCINYTGEKKKQLLYSRANLSTVWYVAAGGTVVLIWDWALILAVIHVTWHWLSNKTSCCCFVPFWVSEIN